MQGWGDESERYDPSKYDAVPIFPTSGISIRMMLVFIPSRVLMPAVVVMTNACPSKPDGAILVLFILAKRGGVQWPPYLPLIVTGECTTKWPVTHHHPSFFPILARRRGDWDYVPLMA